MAWKYVSSEGKTYYVGLFHSEENGHLVIYCGSNILQVDFNVLQASTYSFLIDDDLCEVVIEPAKSGFSYQFFANREKEAERKEKRKLLDRKHLTQTLLFGAFFILIIIAGAIWMVSAYREKIQEEQEFISRVGKGKASATAVVEVEPQNGDTILVYYRFSANGQDYGNAAIMLPTGKTPAGLPVEDGDEFTVFYVENQAHNNSLKLSMPVVAQIERYRKRVSARHAALNPNLTEQRVACQLDIALQLKGLEGWADFYFQDATPTENPLNNNLTYKRLIRDVPFKQAEQKTCW